VAERLNQEANRWGRYKPEGSNGDSKLPKENRKNPLIWRGVLDGKNGVKFLSNQGADVRATGGKETTKHSTPLKKDGLESVSIVTKGGKGIRKARGRTSS